MENIFNQIINNFDFAYMLVVNVLTYLMIKVCDYFNGSAKVPIIAKRVILLSCVGIVTGIYMAIGYENKIVLINSAIVAPVAWSWILKPIINKMGFGYKQNKF